MRHDHRRCWAALLAACAGCTTFSNLKTARSLDVGTLETTLAIEGETVTVQKSLSSTYHHNADPGYAIPVEVAVRYGITDNWDLGGKVWPFGGEANATLSIIRGRVVDLAIAPALGFGLNDSLFPTGQNCVGGGSCRPPMTSQFSLRLPVLVGLRFGPGGIHEIVFAPQLVGLGVVAGFIQFDGGPGPVGLLAGGSLGVSLRLTDSVRIMPEATVMAPVIGVYGEPRGEASGYGWPGSVFYQAALGFSFGTRARDRFAP